MKRTTLVLFSTVCLLILGLTACERPAPGSEQPPPTATIPAPLLGATSLPGAASPTPAQVIPIDPNAPLGASPTPGAVATTDPAVASPGATAPPAPEATASQPQPGPSGEIIHIVQPGENLYRIGLRYGFTYQELAAYNGITNPNALEVGQQIRIPPTP
ncbi:MAG TPA: LysM peptidoglycan-binding domain-containing protein [Promineifilum sp.]